MVTTREATGNPATDFAAASNREVISSTMAKSQAGTTKSSTNMPKKGVFTKANERKKRSTLSKSGIDRSPPNKFTPANGASSAQEDNMDDDHMSDYVDISVVDDIMEDKDLTETSIFRFMIHRDILSVKQEVKIY